MVILNYLHRGMKFDRQNLFLLNKDEKIPHFTGIFYHFKTSARKMSQEEDEFVSIEEDGNQNNFQNKTNGHFHHKNNEHSNGGLNQNSNDHTMQSNLHSNSYVTSLNTKKNINDLDSLFDTIPIEMNVTPQGVNQNKNNNNNNTQTQFMQNNNVLFENTNEDQNNHHIPNQNNEDDDEFVDIDENESSSRKQSVDVNKQNLITNQFPQGQNFQNVNNHNINLGFANTDSLPLAVQENLNNKINNNQNLNEHTPKTEEKQELNFQQLIFHKEHKHVNKNEDEGVVTSNTMNDSKINNTLTINQNESKPIVSLDDLFNSLDTNEQRSEIETNQNLNNREENIPYNIQEVHSNNNQEKTNQVGEIDDLEFCDVEEKDDEKSNNIDLSSIPTTPLQNNHATDNLFFQNNENNTQNQNTAQLNKLQITTLVPDSNTNNQFEFTTPTPNSSKNTPDNVFDFSSNQQEVKEETPKVSILNYTPVDFLNDFKKENKGVHSSNDKKHDEFEFVEENEEPLTSEPSIPPLDLNLPPIEIIFKYKIKDENSISKIKENLSTIVRTLTNEYTNMRKNLSQLQNFFNLKKYSKFIFENDRKLSTFLSSSQHMILFGDRITSVVDKISKSSNKELINEKNLLTKEIKKFYSTPTEKFNPPVQLDFQSLEQPLKEFAIDAQEVAANKNYKLCHICLHNINEEANTNIFGYDFHITCINFWLNLIANHSPFN